MKLELYRRHGQGRNGRGGGRHSRGADRPVWAIPAPVERLLEVARLRIAASRAGIASLAREGHELIVRFQSDWSRRPRCAPWRRRHSTDRVPGIAPGAVTYGSNQMRIRLARIRSGLEDDAQRHRAPRDAAGATARRVGQRPASKVCAVC